MLAAGLQRRQEPAQEFLFAHGRVEELHSAQGRLRRGHRAGLVEEDHVHGRPMRSSTSPPRTRTPARAARPMASAVASGAAMPIAHGQATTSTASAANPPWPGPAASSQNSPGAGGQRQHRRDERRGHPLGHSLRRRRRRPAPRSTMFDDPPQEQVLAHPLGLDDEPCSPLTVPAMTAIAGPADPRLGFAGEGGFLNDGPAFDDPAVRGDALAGPHAHAVAGAQERRSALSRGPSGFDPQTPCAAAASRRPRTSWPVRAFAVASISLPNVTSAGSMVAVSK